MSMGLNMMMKSLGVDPAEIFKAAEDVRKMLAAAVEQQNRIEAKLDLLIAERHNAPALPAPHSTDQRENANVGYL